MNIPEVAVRELSPADTIDQIAKYAPRGVNLGDRWLSERVNRLLAKLQVAGKTAFLLTWSGSKIPRGVVLQGHTISWTQNGQVVAESREMIGTYDRLVEFGGSDGNLQMMLIYMCK